MLGARIIVVDDDDAIRFIVCNLARETVPSATIKEHTMSLHALREVELGADLLITNCEMPDMDGPTLVSKIRGMKNPIPIIMVSGSDEARKLGENAGIDVFVAKTNLSATLGDAIRNCLTTAGGQS